MPGSPPGAILIPENLLNTVAASDAREKAILVGIAYPPETPRVMVEEYLEELAFLADTAGADIEKSMIQERRAADPGFAIGSGKVDELRSMVKDREADIVIF